MKKMGNNGFSKKWFSLARLTTLAVLTLWIPMTWATPIYYDEAVSGDVDSLFYTPTFDYTGFRFIFDEGTNTMKGSVSFSAMGFSETDQFWFTIVDGQVLESATISFTNVRLGSSFIGQHSFDVGSAIRNEATEFISVDLAFDHRFYNESDVTRKAFPGLPITANTYNFALSSWGYAPGLTCSTEDANCSVSFDYELSMNVASVVSEPYVPALFLSTLVLFIRRKWCKRQQH